jgi:glutaminyl-tRNA synthetase
LRYAYIIKCVDVIKDADGQVTELHCTYDPDTRSGDEGAQRKVKGTIHWVSAAEAKAVKVRLYDRLFNVAEPDAAGDGRAFKEFLNPDSLAVIKDCRVEPSVANIKPGEFVQFERTGYFVADRIDSTPGQPVFNRIVTLRDSWAKIEKSVQ